MILLSAVCFLRLPAQLNVQLLHQLVEHSKDEHARQLTARNRQATTSALEEVNDRETSRLKSRYRTLQSRFMRLGAGLELLGAGIQSAPLISEIIDQQKKIFSIAGDHPQLAVLALRSEHDISARALQLGRYVTALFINLGELNQMKSSDRRLLYGHAIDELRTLASCLRGLAASMRRSAIKKTGGPHLPFSDLVETDKRIVESILEQIKEVAK